MVHIMRIDEMATLEQDFAGFLANKYKLTSRDGGNTFDCNDDVTCEKDLVRNGQFILKFGNIKGDFDCSGLGLTTLNGAPEYVSGRFDCSNNQLASLVGGPEEVDGEYDCSYNNLTSIEGAPKCVYVFDCSNNQLTSLAGGPEEVDSGYDCSSNKLTSFRGHPDIMYGYFDCGDNPLAYPKRKPSWIDGEYNPE